VVVLVVPVTLFVASSLNVSPLPFLISEILATNIEGTATLIGDPPNLLIASAAGIDSLHFAVNLAPISLLILLAYLGLAWFAFKNDMRGVRGDFVNLAALDTTGLITNPILLRKTGIVGALILLAFLLQGTLHLEAATIALSGATVLLLWGGSDVEHVLRDIEWTTLFFFVGLFIVVEAIVQVGIIEALAHGLLSLTHANLPLTTLLILWGSAGASSVVDNIPYTATMIPVVLKLGNTLHATPLWWALALAADLGGNAMLVGASSNIIVASLAARSGHPISFKSFLLYGLATSLMSPCWPRRTSGSATCKASAAVSESD
jgi:Na+/H+ antiporter NhaD/arsenite permease-like protein